MAHVVVAGGGTARPQNNSLSQTTVRGDEPLRPFELTSRRVPSLRGHEVGLVNFVSSMARLCFTSLTLIANSSSWSPAPILNFRRCAYLMPSTARKSSNRTLKPRFPCGPSNSDSCRMSRLDLALKENRSLLDGEGLDSRTRSEER